MASIMAPEAAPARGTLTESCTKHRPVTADKITNSCSPNKSRYDPNKLCDKCLNDEMLLSKQLREAELQHQDALERVRLAEEARAAEDRERRERAEKFQRQKEDAMKAISESAKKRSRGDDRTEREMNEKASEEFERARQAESARRTGESKQYRDELREQIDAKRREAEEKLRRERAGGLTSLNIRDGDGRHQVDVLGYKQGLQDQIRTERLQKSKDPKEQLKERELHSRMDEIAASLEKQKRDEDLQKRADIKGQYQAYLQEKDAKSRLDRDAKARELENFETQKRSAEQERELELKREMDKKRTLGSYLASQIQDKETKRDMEKRNKEKERPVDEFASRPHRAESPETKTLVADNLKMIQQKAAAKAHDKEKDQMAENEYLDRERRADEMKQQEELRKKDELRKDMQVSLSQVSAKRAKEEEERRGKKGELEYYDNLNKQLRDLVQQEQRQQKDKANDYKSSLQSQMAANEEAKRRQREEDLAKERSSKGFDLEAYKRKDAYDRRAYNEELKRQYMDEVMRKSASKANPKELEELRRMDELAAKLKQDQQADEYRKKAEQNADYKSAMEMRGREKAELDRRNAEDKARFAADAKSAEQLQEEERLRDLNKKLELKEALSSQLEAEKAKRAKERSERCEWADERGKKQLQELEKKMSDLKEEIARCIKCNGPIVRRAYAGRMSKPLIS